MRFLLDENQSPLLGEHLAGAGHDVAHVRDVGLRTESDRVVLEFARAQGRVLVSGDTDFGDILARTGATGPSVLMIRRQRDRRAAQVAALVLTNFDTVVDDLSAGGIVVLDADRIRIRRLPIL